MSDDYIYGFCKTAYEHGVDPEALLKEASLAGMVSKYLADGAALAAKRKAAYGALERIRSLGNRLDDVRRWRHDVFKDIQRNNGRLVVHNFEKEGLKSTRYKKRMLYKELLNSVKDINNQFGTNILPQDVKNYWRLNGRLSDGVNKILGIAEQADAALRHHNIAGATAAAAAAGAGTGGAYALGRGIGALRSADPNTQVTP